jgi:hypothetical protein
VPAFPFPHEKKGGETQIQIQVIFLLVPAFPFPTKKSPHSIKDVARRGDDINRTDKHRLR